LHEWHRFQGGEIEEEEGGNGLLHQTSDDSDTCTTAPCKEH